MGTLPKKGRFTFRSAAVLLALSAALEIAAITSAVPLFGEFRSGPVAAIYHLAYAGLFLALAFGLWEARRWGYLLVLVTTILYTLDMLQFALNQAMLETYIQSRLSGVDLGSVLPGADERLLAQSIILASVMAVLCWWGFAIYAHVRRDYFGVRREG